MIEPSVSILNQAGSELDRDPKNTGVGIVVRCKLAFVTNSDRDRFRHIRIEAETDFKPRLRLLICIQTERRCAIKTRRQTLIGTGKIIDISTPDKRRDRRRPQLNFSAGSNPNKVLASEEIFLILQGFLAEHARQRGHYQVRI